ncbi:MAG: hypothetical protein R6V03_03275 [Kiritimatiellia bacterium]
MRTVVDFEDMLVLLEKHKVRYLIVGGLAFIYHAKPRYTKDIDIWIEASVDNVEKGNGALTEFGSPTLMDPAKPNEIVQIGVEPSRIDMIRSIEGVDFDTAWSRRERATYGGVETNWIDLDSLLAVKSLIDKPKHREDARVLLEIKKIRES